MKTARAFQAWLAATRHELIAPADALVRGSDSLVRDAPDDVPPRYKQALENIRTRANQLRQLVTRFAQSGQEFSDEMERTIRHDLRGHAAYIIGVAELWRRQAAKHQLDAYATRLQELETAGQDVVRLLERLAAVPPGADTTGVEMPGVADVLRYLEELPPSLERGRILVVDDNAYNRDYFQQMLEEQGHDVAVAEDAGEAMLLLGNHDFDLILLDVMMPVVSGFGLLERLKASEHWRHLPVIMMSALGDEQSIVNGIARGAEDYLTRPVNPLLLRARIGACLEKKRLRDRENEYVDRIDQLLHAIFPPEVVAELKETASVRPKRFERVGVLFLDVVGFTAFCDGCRDRPEEVVNCLQKHHLAFERIARSHGVQKIKTIGDAFMGAAGLLRPCDNPAARLLRCGLEMAQAARSGVPPWEVRVGIHVGPVVAGVVGETQFSFDLWGDAVNTAARMESTGKPGDITFSAEAWQEVASIARGEARQVVVRGKGIMEVVRFVEFIADPPPSP